jgi:hypothetical protein
MDAYSQSIIFPIVGNAEKEISIFKEWVKTGDTGFIPHEERLYRATVELEIKAAKAQALKNASDQLALEFGVGQAQALVGLETLGLCPKPLVPDVKAPYLVKFYVPPGEEPYVLDWSRSNLERLFDIGYESGRIFLQENPDI